MENGLHIVVVPEDEWKTLLTGQAELIKLLKELRPISPVASSVVPYITAMEFMQAVRIGRTKFDQLVQANRIKTVKIDRKIYVPVGEVERYFTPV
jgi:hypothetical protein